MGPFPIDSQGISLYEECFGPLPHGNRISDILDILDGFNHLPYENLSKIVALQTDGIEGAFRLPKRVMAEHLLFQTGGTCFSLTELLRQIVCQAGFYAYPVMAHMRHGNNIHCALVVTIEDTKFLIDPGYLIRTPLALDEKPKPLTQFCYGEPFIVPAGTIGGIPMDLPQGTHDLFTIEKNGPQWRYRFTDSAPSVEEFLSHWRNSFFLPGMRSLIVTQKTHQGQRLYLHNYNLRQDGPEGKKNKNLKKALEHSVQDIFGIDERVTHQALNIILAQKQGKVSHGPKK